MTFKDLQKLVQSQSGPDQSQLLLRLRVKPFWIWDKANHKQEDIKTKGDCCFNHVIGLPRKDGIEKSIFDYEKLLYDSLVIPEFCNPAKHNFKEKHLWVKKATGLGVTEFMLRFMAWLCLRNNDYRNSQMCIVTGPNQDIAIKLIKRMKALFEEKLGITFASKETVLELDGCVIEAFPSNHLDAFRSLTNPKFILLDEADFFRKSEQEDVRHVSERYIAKSDPFIVMVSTPYAPDGLFDSIEKEPDESCIYKRILLDYTYGLDKIYTCEEIEKAKVSPSFEREYNLKYLGGIGNVFHIKDIDAAIEKGKLYDPNSFNTFAKKCMGIDPAYGSSSFGIVITQFVDGEVQIIHAEEYKRPDFNEMLSKTWDLLVKHSVQKIYIDGANPSFIKSLKMQWGERHDYENVKKEHRQFMKVQPVNFNQGHKEMLGHCKMLLERGYIAINPAFDKLITSLRTAVAEENALDKESTSYADVFDAYRMALKHYQFITKEIEDIQSVKVKKRPIRMPNIPTRVGRYCVFHGIIHKDEYLECDFCNEHKDWICSKDRYYNYGFSRRSYLACMECYHTLFGPFRLIDGQIMLRAYEEILEVINDKTEKKGNETINFYEAVRIAYTGHQYMRKFINSELEDIAEKKQDIQTNLGVYIQNSEW